MRSVNFSWDILLWLNDYLSGFKLLII